MSRFSRFTEMNEEKSSDLRKCYITIKKELIDEPGLSYKEYATENYFIYVNEDNIKDLKIDKSLPILTYHGEITQMMLDKGAKIENVYNRPIDIEKSSSKEKFYKIVGKDENLPVTVYNKSDALKLGFPLIGKPSKGHSGKHIQVFNNKEEFENADHERIDTYSEYIDKKSEHRFILFKNRPIFWMERKPLNDKAKTGSGKSDSEMEFMYIRKDVKNVPENLNKVLVKYSKILKDLPYICFDIMEDKSGHVYIIEPNAQPGIPFDASVIIYKAIFEDFFNRKISPNSLKELDKHSKYLNKYTVDSDNERFRIYN